MKRLFLIFVCVVTIFCFLSNGWSIERVQKSAATGDEAKKQKDSLQSANEEKNVNISDEQKKTTELETKGTKEEGKKEIKKKKQNILDKLGKSAIGGKDDYDYFLDKNHNGIDDRLEKETTKKSQVKEEKSKASISREKEKVPQETVKPAKPEKESSKKETGERKRK
jgi:FtsZ-interacting cell division protein ZipA